MNDIIREIKICIAIIIMMPYAAYNFYCVHKKKIIAILAALVLIFIIAVFSRTTTEVFSYIDYTDVFDTGEKRPRTKYIVLHHAAGNAKISDIFNIHCRQNQWKSVGYHYFIDVDGEIYNLRTDDEKAPHTLNYNSCSVGICMNGNFNISQPTEKQMKSCMHLVKELQEKYGIPNENVVGHKELNATECPGNNFDLNKFMESL